MYDQIGVTAGKIWHYLDGHGEVTIAKLVKDLKPDATRDMVQRGVGWLAREGKVHFRKDKIGEKISLKK